MAAKRNKSQARRNGGGKSGVPGWMWLVAGVVLCIGIFVALIAGGYMTAPKFLAGDDGFFRPKPNADAQPPAIDATSDDEPIAQGNGSGDDAATGKAQDYDFYTLLPGEETALSDRELAERERAEQAQRQRAADAADDAGNSGNDASPPVEDDTTPPPAIDAAPARTVDAGTPAAPAKPEKVADGSATRDDARYLLQAGAFQASGDAETLKAKIAFLGLSARVESAQIKGQTVYRVRMGPYGTATELAEAKRKLASGGLPAMAVKAR